MTTIDTCRTAALGRHVGPARIAGTSASPITRAATGTATRTPLEQREAELLPVGFFRVVFALPAEAADIALRNNEQVSTCCSRRRRIPC